MSDPFSAEDTLDYTMISWLPGPEVPLRYLTANSIRMDESGDLAERWTNVPLGVSVFPDTYSECPPAWLACLQPLIWITRHHGPDVGWPIWERPNELADDLKTFFGMVMLQRDPRLREIPDP